MNRKTWYFVSLSLPIMIPLILFLLGLVVSVIFGRDAGMVFSGTGAYFGVMQMMAMPQYILFCIGVYLWSRHENVEVIKNRINLLPLLFIPVCGVLLGLWIYLTGEPKQGVGLEVIPGMLMISAPFVLLFGYFYVLLAHAFTKLFQKIGWVVD